MNILTEKIHEKWQEVLDDELTPMKFIKLCISLGHDTFSYGYYEEKLFIEGNVVMRTTSEFPDFKPAKLRDIYDDEDAIFDVAQMLYETF